MASSRLYIKKFSHGTWEPATEQDMDRFLATKFSVLQVSGQNGYTMAMDVRIPLNHYDSEDIVFLKTLNEKIEKFLKSYFHSFDTGIVEEPPKLD